jgi:O-antigen/teichoic acid export membrane protein
VAQLGFRGVALAELTASSYGRLALILSVFNTVMIVGASGLPNSAARYVAAIVPDDDRPVIASAVRASIWPVAVATVLGAVLSALLLRSPVAGLLCAIGLPSLVYGLLMGGILRGRGRLVSAASIQPATSAVQLLALVALWASDEPLTPLSAFSVFCAGNVAGVALGVWRVTQTDPTREAAPRPAGSPASVPRPREMLSASVWLAGATIAVALLPLVMRSVAAFESYAVVAVVDVALVLLIVPQRLGVVLVQAVVPRATQALRSGRAIAAISRREHVLLVTPFAAGAALAAFTPIVTWPFDLISRPEYADSADYLALALLAGPARVLYGLVQGVLVAHGDNRFLAGNAWAITLAASLAMLGAAALGSTMGAFAGFVLASWAVYLQGLRRLDRLSSAAAP